MTDKIRGVSPEMTEEEVEAAALNLIAATDRDTVNDLRMLLRAQGHALHDWRELERAAMRRGRECHYLVVFGAPTRRGLAPYTEHLCWVLGQGEAVLNFVLRMLALMAKPELIDWVTVADALCARGTPELMARIARELALETRLPPGCWAAAQERLDSFTRTQGGTDGDDVA